MPEPNEGDVFYDIEGFPQADQRPFEYLHGIYFYNGKEFNSKILQSKTLPKQKKKKF